MILTYKFAHNRDFSTEINRAFKVANFVVKNPKCRSSRIVKDFGLKSTISNQILKKYGHSKTIKHVHNVNLIVPGQGVKYYEETNSIWIPCIKLHLENLIPVQFTKINQAELDNEYVYISVTVPEPEMIPYTNIIGVDRNTTGHIVVTANPDTGQVRKMGKSPMHIRTKYRNMRTKLQKAGKFRDLNRIKNRENRIVKDLNHKISKELVSMAKVQHAALVFEDLNGIRNTKKQHRSFKPSLHSWSFYQLQTFVEYKAKLLGVPVIYVDPAYTSQDCSICGEGGQRYKKDFKCPACGHVDHADVNAAFNIAKRQQSMIDRMQKKMCTMGTLISHGEMLDGRPVTLEPHEL